MVGGFEESAETAGVDKEPVLLRFGRGLTLLGVALVAGYMVAFLEIS